MADQGFIDLLREKWAFLADQAARDRTITQQNANTNTTVGEAAAKLDTTRANLLPAESAANIAQTRANANLITQQASVVRPVAFAGIGQTNAETGLTRANTASVNQRNELASDPLSRGPLAQVMGSRGFTPFRLGAGIYDDTYQPTVR